MLTFPGYQTITSTYGPSSSTVTQATPSGSSSGTIVVYQPATTVTTTTYVANGSPGYTSVSTPINIDQGLT
jgi:hypothetical protein